MNLNVHFQRIRCQVYECNDAAAEMACWCDLCQLVVGPVTVCCRVESAQSGPRVERAREVVAGVRRRAVKDRPPVFVEGGRPASSGSRGTVGLVGWLGKGGGGGNGGGGGQEGFLTKRL